MDLLASVLSSAALLYDGVRSVRSNQHRCASLARRVSVLVPLLQRLSKADLAALQPSLAALSECLIAMVRLVHELSTNGFLQRLMKCAEYDQELTRCSEWLNGICHDLHLGLAVDSLLDRQQDNKDRQDDIRSLQRGQEEAVRALHEMEATKRRAEGRDTNFQQQRLDSPQQIVRAGTGKLQLPPSPSSSPPPFSPSSLDRCSFRRIPFVELELIARVGSGSSGEVWRGRWSRAETEVAVKLLKPSLDDELSSGERLMRECELLQQLGGCEHVVAFHGAVVEEDKQCLVMEYVGGGSLWQQLRSAGSAEWTWDHRCHLAHQLVESINFLHQQQQRPVLHHDINSRNFLVDHSQTVKVRLGQSRLRAASTVQQYTSSQWQDNLAWTAPEQLQLRRTEYNQACDVFSLGVVLWELATGYIPYDELDGQLIRAAVMAGERLDIPQHVPDHFRAWITRCWAQSAEQRPTCSELLQHIREHLPPTASSPRLPDTLGASNASSAAVLTTHRDPTRPSAIESAAPPPFQPCGADGADIQAEQAALVLLAKQGAVLRGADIVKLMTRPELTHSVKLQEATCRALSKLTYSNRKDNAAIVASGGVSCLIQCMTGHEQRAGIQEHGCRSLRNLLQWTDQSSVVQEQLTATHGVERVVRAMDVHVEELAVQINACDALRVISQGVDGKQRLVAAGGLQSVLRAMDAHIHTAALQWAGLALLSGICAGDDSASKQVAVAGGAQSCLRAMRHHVAVSAVQQQSKSLLAQLKQFIPPSSHTAQVELMWDRQARIESPAIDS